MKSKVQRGRNEIISAQWMKATQPQVQERVLNWPSKKMTLTPNLNLTTLITIHVLHILANPAPLQLANRLANPSLSCCHQPNQLARQRWSCVGCCNVLTDADCFFFFPFEVSVQEFIWYCNKLAWRWWCEVDVKKGVSGGSSGTHNWSPTAAVPFCNCSCSALSLIVSPLPRPTD